MKFSSTKRILILSYSDYLENQIQWPDKCKKFCIFDEVDQCLMEELVRILPKQKSTSQYTITYPNSILKEIDCVIGISGTTTDQIEHTLKQPGDKDFASLNIQHLNQNSINHMTDQIKFENDDIYQRNIEINEQIRSHIGQRPVIIIDEHMDETGQSNLDIDEDLKQDNKIYKFFGFNEISQYAGNNAKLVELKNYENRIIIHTTMIGARGVDFKCGE